MRWFCLMVMGLLTAASTAPDETQVPETDIQVTKVAENIHVFSCFYGSHYVNVTAFSGPDGTLLIDTGHKRTARALAGKLAELALGDVTCIINTHLHGDHTGGNEALGSDATIIAHENTRRRLDEHADDSVQARFTGLPDSVITDSLTLHVNGDTVRIIHLPNGHTDGDVVVHLVGAAVVCMGDLLFADALPHVFKYQGGSLDGFIDNLGTVLGAFPDDVTLIPGHGRIYTMSELKKYRDMLVGLTERIRGEFRLGKEMDEIFGAGVLQEWSHWVSQEYVSDTAFILIVWDNDRDE